MKNALILAAVAANDIPLLETLHVKFDLLSCSRELLDAASYFDNLEALAYLHELGHPGCTTNAMDRAAELGHLNIVKFLIANRTEGCTIGAMDWAAGSGHLDVMKFLDKHRSEGCSEFAIELLDRLGIPWSSDLTKDALLHGSMENHAWTHEKHPHIFVEMDENPLKSMAKKGNVERIEWLCDVVGLECSLDLLKDTVIRRRRRGMIVDWLVATMRFDRATIEKHIVERKA